MRGERQWQQGDKGDNPLSDELSIKMCIVRTVHEAKCTLPNKPYMQWNVNTIDT
jgi:hypothetical protein